MRGVEARETAREKKLGEWTKDKSGDEDTAGAWSERKDLYHHLLPPLGILYPLRLFLALNKKHESLIERERKQQRTPEERRNRWQSDRLSWDKEKAERQKEAALNPYDCKS